MPLLLRINDIVARTGVRTARFTIPGHELIDNVQMTESTVLETGRNRFMVLSISKAAGQFVRLRPDMPRDRYRVGQEARRWVGDLLELSTEQIADRTFVCVEIHPPLGLDLFVEVDTDHPALVKAAAERDLQARGTETGRGAKGVHPKVDLRIDVVVVNDAGEMAQSQVEDIAIQLMPVNNMPAYDGYAALDFGNTSTALVVSDTNQRERFEVIPADVRRPTSDAAKPVLTALGITGIRPPAQQGGFLNYTAVIGTNALDMTDGAWLVLGAKRLLSDRKAGNAAEETVVIGNDVRQIPAEDPAEVYISQMLQGMFFHRQARPHSITVTCPTTFTASEVSRLRRTVARAFHRATDGNAARFNDGRIESFVPLVIDEASAAAFYFAHRDFIVGPGATPAFRYLYPNGLQMLLYDCGGGTTDLALVRLEAHGSGEVEIRVLGRAGHRQFGGDFITQQVFRLLKAKLAVSKRAIESFPRNVGQIAAFLDNPDNQKAIDRAVPTTYDRTQQQNTDARRRRQTTLELWRLAESLKVRLSEKGTREVRPDLIQEGTSELDLLTQVLDRVGLPEGQEPADVAATISITRQEVDSLVDRQIDETIAYANDLVRDGLAALKAEQAAAGREEPLEIPEVDRVYIVGNASRYPRIRERLVDPEHGLQIRYIEQRLAEVKPEDFKNSVAKGAIVANRLRDMHTATRVTWDEGFMERLPYDLVSETLAHEGDRVLFRRGQRYSKELVSWREIAPDAKTGRPTTQKILLERIWPGEDARREACMIFQFDEPVAGRFVIRYDEELATFVMHPDRAKGAEEMLVIAEPFEQAAYLAPPQSGRI